jgi:hypothetical protein
VTSGAPLVGSVRGWAVVVAALAAVTGVACGGAELLPPTTGTPVPLTEVFSGTLGPNGAATHPFAAQAGGSVTVTLQELEPDTTIGLSLGTWNGASCQIVIANDTAVRQSSVIGTVSGVGDLCVRVYDVGILTGPASYTVSVLHP